MAFEFDPAKDEANWERHGRRLSEFAGFDDDPVVMADVRRDYGENRYRAFGRIDGLPHCLVFTYRGANIRLVSFRRAHEKEIDRYERPSR
ncbi:MAG TPA: BrnT family toxin [Allosphingosinicella sp.]|nr:BrnT family toxin [Allosphingosinicella sp.]